MENKLRIGVWPEGQFIIRRDSNKEPTPRKYRAKKPEDTEKAMSLLIQIQNGNQMSSWTA